MSFATLCAAALLTAKVVADGPMVALDEQFFVDPFNVFLVALTAFVGFTTALFSRPYMRIEEHHGRLNSARLRLYHSMYQLFSFTMVLCLLSNNVGILWVALEGATLSTVLLKVMLIPWVLHRLIDRLNVKWDVETLINIPATMLVGIGLAIFAFSLATPISQMASTLTRSTLGIAMASILLSFLMMIVRRKAVPQVIGFLAMENGLFLAATSATYGMPLVVELGVALDVLVGTFIFGIFFFHIREQFDSLDIRHMEKLKED